MNNLVERIGVMIEESWLVTFAAIGIVILCAVIIYKLFIWLLRRYDKTISADHRGRTYNRLMASFTRFALVVTTFFIVLYLLGVDITSMLAGLGIAGFAVSFAVQDMATDVIRGIGIIADSYCQVGDVILYKGMEAEVLTIGIRTTRVRILANDNIISIANRNISEVEVLSWKYVESFPMPYDLSIYQSEKVVRDIVNRISKNEFVENCKYVGVTELGSSAVYYNLEVRSDPMYRRQVRRDTLRSIMLGMEENHVPVPYNQLDVHTVNDAERAAGYAELTDTPDFRNYVEKSHGAANDSIFRTEKFSVLFTGENVEQVLDGAERFVWRMGCSRAERLQVRLLTEELMEALREIAPEFRMTVEYRGRGKRCNVRAIVKYVTDEEKKENLLELYSANDSLEGDGIVGMVRGVTARFMAADQRQGDQTWNLREQLKSILNNDAQTSAEEMKMTQSEIQKRIIAKVADDITINSNDDEVVIDAVKYF